MKKYFYSIFLFLAFISSAHANFAKSVDDAISGPAKLADKVVFYTIEVLGNGLPIVLIILGSTSIFLTLYFRFINFRGIGLAIRTVRGKYTNKDAPGQISHFQALTAALSATVGLGNIAGVAVAVGIGGPGATFWMIIMGLCGMTTKFAECTLGVKYREIDSEGRTKGGAMYYLKKGFAERGMGVIGIVLAALFAVLCIGGAIGAGNLFQVNQAYSQFSSTFGVLEEGNGSLIFGIILAVITGLVIIGGIKSIGRVTSVLIPLMCGTYVVAASIIIFSNIDQLGNAFGQIFSGAFAPMAVGGGIVGVLIQGIKRASFSNEAGIGSAPIAHSAVKTDKPASEGIVALLEPFTDTVVVCTMTALVLIMSGAWKVDAVAKTDKLALLSSPDTNAAIVQTVGKGEELRFIGKTDKFSEVYISEDKSAWVETESVESIAGVKKTSKAFAETLPWFPKVLAISVLLFAFSTMISWSYYGEQAVTYLCGGYNHYIVLGYKIFFLICTVIGTTASMGNIVLLSDAMIFAMVIPNLIGVYLLLPIVKDELNKFMKHAKEIDAK